jgi:hypothetical protein
MKVVRLITILHDILMKKILLVAILLYKISKSKSNLLKVNTFTTLVTIPNIAIDYWQKLLNFDMLASF